MKNSTNELVAALTPSKLNKSAGWLIATGWLTNRCHLASPPSFTIHSTHSGLKACRAGLSSSRAGPAHTSHWHWTPHWEPITTPALLTAHYHSIRQVHLQVQPSDEHRPPRCMFNIRENYIVTANTKRLTHITWLPQDWNPIIGAGRGGGGA